MRASYTASVLSLSMYMVAVWILMSLHSITRNVYLFHFCRPRVWMSEKICWREIFRYLFVLHIGNRTKHSAEGAKVNVVVSAVCPEELVSQACRCLP